MSLFANDLLRCKWEAAFWCGIFKQAVCSALLLLKAFCPSMYYCSASEMCPENALGAQLRELLSPIFVWPDRPLDAPTFLWVLQAAIHVLHCSVHFFAVTDIELDSSHSVTLHVVQILGATISLVLEGKKELVWIWPKNLCVRSNVYQLLNQARECAGQSEWSGQSCSTKGHRQGCSCRRTPFLEQFHLTISPAIELAATNCCGNQESRWSWICPARLLLPSTSSEIKLWSTTTGAVVTLASAQGTTNSVVVVTV